MLVTRAAPPLGIFCSVSDQNLSESVVSSRSPRFHWELQSRDVSGQPSWIVPPAAEYLSHLNFMFLHLLFDQLLLEVGTA